MNDQEWLAWQRQGDAIRAHREARSDAAKLEAARLGPHSATLADLERRVNLAEIRLRSIAEFGISAGRTMTPAESLSFDEGMIEIANLQKRIRELVG